MRIVLQVIVAVVVVLFAYDYYSIRQDALCAHNAVTHQTGK